MDHGDPSVDGAAVWFCSDEHLTFAVERDGVDGGAPMAFPEPGVRIRVQPAHVDPTFAYHERLYLVEGDAVVDIWSVDLRGW
jgi:D-serine deaminase-like pyridoxal phosphate-dependent protein